MLRITVENGSLTKRLKLEGKLAHEWVSEAEKAWSDLAASNARKTIVVDLFDVAFVDHLGWQLLAQMHHAGAKLMGSGPMISSLIEEIEDAEAALKETSEWPVAKKTGEEPEPWSGS
jgi:anti-anti-sigma regulatory factor